MPARPRPRPAGLSGTAVSSDPMKATKNAPEMPSETSGKPERLDDQPQAQALGRPDEDGQDHERQPSGRRLIENTPSSNRS